ncbi:MAG: hypothetical protein EBZ59_11030, partial [Planctomycetia bacterium]|nr:hypothetical protein [Planctomycetia bacterium]
MLKRLHVLVRAAACGLAVVGAARCLPGGDLGRALPGGDLGRPLSGGDLGRIVEGLAAPFRAMARGRPETCPDEAIERLGAEIAWLERQIDLHGSIVAKAPDVWGQSRLVRHRHEVEEQLRLELPRFAETSQAAIRRSDQSFLGMALALQAAAGRRPGTQLVPVPEAGGTAVAAVQTLLPSTNETGGRTDPVVIARTAPFATPAGATPFATGPLAVEPTLHLDHLSRYLNHLSELRRINEGDDSADSPGYSLNLVRIPVSVIPGGRTRRGHGAEITITAD